jgi:membrane protein implicated in regulation of membrane protease activity
MSTQFFLAGVAAFLCVVLVYFGNKVELLLLSPFVVLMVVCMWCFVRKNKEEIDELSRKPSVSKMKQLVFGKKK